METDKLPLYIVALILNPKHHIDYIKRCWPEKWQKDTLLRAKNLWEKYWEEYLVAILSEKQPEPEVQEEQLDLFNHIMRDINNKYTYPAS